MLAEKQMDIIDLRNHWSNKVVDQPPVNIVHNTMDSS